MRVNKKFKDVLEHLRYVVLCHTDLISQVLVTLLKLLEEFWLILRIFDLLLELNVEVKLLLDSTKDGLKVLLFTELE